MMNKIIILVDVDGVFSPITTMGGDVTTEMLETWDREQWVQATSPGSFNLWAATPVIETLKKLEEKAVVKWHTSWLENAPLILNNDFGVTWGLTDGLTEARNNLNDDEWFKQVPIEKLLEDDWKIVWCDDDQRMWDLFYPEDRVRVFCPESKHGLTAQHLAEITDIVNEWSET